MKENKFTGNYFYIVTFERQIANPMKKGCKNLFNAINTSQFNHKDWKTINKFKNSYCLEEEEIIKQIKSLAQTSLLPECRDLQYSILRNTCITNEKLFHWKKVPTPACLLCNQNSQNSEHRFYDCPEIRPVWDLTSNLLQSTGIFIFIDKQTALLNSFDEHKNSFPTTIINYTRMLIDKAHFCNNKIHPNTFLHKLNNIANIFKHNDSKHNHQWNRLERTTIEPLNPLTLKL